MLGDFIPGRSDLDVLVIVNEAASTPEIDAIVAAFQASDASPALGFEASIVSDVAALNPVEPWPYLVHVVTGEGGHKTVRDIGRGDRDLILHYAVARAHGWVGSGRRVENLIGKVARTVVLEQLRRELEWAAEHAPMDYAVLNACRALHFQETDTLASKLAGGRWAIDRGHRPELIGAAIHRRTTGNGDLDSAEVKDWATAVAVALSSPEGS